MVSVQTAYNAERGITTGKKCTSGVNCTDEVVRTTTWTGKVGLIYPSDYGYASTNASCRANIDDNTNYPCKNDNWLYINQSYWTLSPAPNSYNASLVGAVGSNGGISYGKASIPLYTIVRPSVYLKSNVYITSGEGSSSNPYKLSVN